MDLRTLLNPPHANWEAEWNSLRDRLRLMIERVSEQRKLLKQKGLASVLATIGQRTARYEYRFLRDYYRTTTHKTTSSTDKYMAALSTKLAKRIPPFALAQIAHLSRTLRHMRGYRMYLSRIFAYGFVSRLAHSPRYSPSHINRTLLRQVTTDMRIVEQAISQRMPFDNKLTWDCHLLHLSDLMAYDVLQPLKDAGIVPAETAIVTYMQRQTDIRMVPYYHILLLGFPSATSNRLISPPNDFLAIPHEIGHYLYRYGVIERIPRQADEFVQTLATLFDWSDEVKEQLGSDTFKAQIQPLLHTERVPCVEIMAKIRKICDLINHNASLNSPLDVDTIRHVVAPRVHEVLASKLNKLDTPIPLADWRHHWLEELFCDAYGCLIAGPINVLGFQILLSDEQYEHDHLNRGKHPIAALRPLILSEMLREMDRRGTASYQHAPDLLDQQWQQHLNNYGMPAHQQNVLASNFTPDGPLEELTGQQMLDALQIVIDQIFELFSELFTDIVATNTDALRSDSNQGATSHAVGEKQLRVPWQIWTSDVDAVPADSANEFALVQAMQQLQNQFDRYYLDTMDAPSGAADDATDSKTQRFMRTPPKVKSSPTAARVRIEAVSNNLRKYKDSQMPIAEWFEVFAVDGWSTEGPRASNDQ